MHTRWDSYIYWLMAIVSPGSEYEKLLYRLSQFDFVPLLEKDINRAMDGVELRTRYSEQRGESIDEIKGRNCSVLEMMAALTIRCEEQITINPLIGNRTKHWFAVMLKSLGLFGMTNEYYEDHYVYHVIDRFLRREYSPTGEGSIFIVRHPAADMRTVELWYQMMWYLDENFKE